MSRACCVLIAILIPPGCDHSHPHSHPHGPADEPEPIGVTIFTDKLELFMEYPPLVTNQAARFLAHFTVLASGEPVREGELHFIARGADGSVNERKLAAPKREGLYVPTMTFGAAGEYEASIAIRGPQVSDEIPLGTLIVFQDEKAMRAAQQAQAAEESPSNTVPFLLEQQWKIGMLLHSVTRHTLVERIFCPGEVSAVPERTAMISSPVSGRLRAARRAKLPQLGDLVQSGQTLALIEPAAPTMNETALYAIDLRTRAVAIERDLADAQANLQYAQREYERLATLERDGISSAKEMFEARRNLSLAESEIAAAMALKAKYEEAAGQLDVYRAAARRPSPEFADDDPLLVRLISPISGQIVESDHADGEQVDPDEEIFRVMDLERVRVVCRISEFDLARVPDSPGAVVTPRAFPDKRLDVFGSGGRIVFFSPIIDLQSRTLALHYELANPDRLLRAGMLADVLLQTRRSEDAIAIPEECLVLDGGIPVVFVLLEGELFQRREVVPGIRDAGMVEVISGLRESERIVARGAQAVKLSTQVGASLGHGHVH